MNLHHDKEAFKELIIGAANELAIPGNIIEKDYYVVKDLDTKEIVHVTQSNFDYEMNCQILKDVEEEESVWIIGFDKETKEYIQI